MGKTYSTLKWKFRGEKAYNEYALHQETERNYVDTLDRVFKQYYYTIHGPKSSNCISMSLDYSQERQALSKIVKLAPQVEKLEYIVCQHIQKNDKKFNKLLGKLRVNQLTRLYLGASYCDSISFSFYARNIARLLPLASGMIEIEYFRIPHKDFGRVLMACGSSPEVRFSGCRIIINGFDYLDNAHPSIRHISLNNNTIIQPEEDNEYLDGLVQKMAQSSLKGSLRKVWIWTPNPIHTYNDTLIKKKYTIGNAHVSIY
ncbi:unnamed protein product [Moneuplotes crassus]|uniref:Uncharacterized protein n=1 Tax=Euplotes crassus TaxID=5936 RepID=A0AAD1XUY1_EUPCR|nr:unnamed protein product [Moneuplotes crassus]